MQKNIFKNIVDLSKLKAFTDDKIKCYLKVEIHIWKVRKHGYQHFLLIPIMFSKGFFVKVIHAIIFSDKSRTMDLIFRDLRWFSGTDYVNLPPFRFLFFFTPHFLFILFLI